MRNNTRHITILHSLLLVLAALLVFSPFSEGSRNRIHGPGTQLGSGVDIEVHALFDRLPKRGFAPVRVTISNNSGREQTWRFAFLSHNRYDSGGSLSHEADLTVAHGEAKRFDILIPIVRSDNFGSLTGYVYGHGIAPGDRELHFSTVYSGYFHGSMPAAVAVSPILSSSNWSKLEEAISSGGRGGGGINGATFDTAIMPTDWRGFAGFDAVCMTDREWLTTGAAERLALLDWVAVGGQLYICREEGDTTALPGLSGLSKEPVSRGFGAIRFWPRTGDDIDIEETRVQIFAKATSAQGDLEHSYRRATWPLLAQLPEVQLRKGLFIGFLLLFAIVIGPANLFFFARGSRRYRLFWTTPAISLGASLAIFLLILLQDGVGGTGHQIGIWSHLPGENKAAVVQEQASRTSLLTKREFSIETPVSLSPIDIQSLVSLSTASLEAGHRSFRGDWFRNRATQAHLIEGVVATRWRIEAAGPAVEGKAPELLSTFPFTLDSVFYQDAAGNWWHAANLQAGQTRRLDPVEKDVFQREWNAFMGDAGAIAKRRLHSPNSRLDHFFAFSENSAEGTWQTLESIDWKTRKSYHTGPLAVSNP